jgi:hypothetical protein
LRRERTAITHQHKMGTLPDDGIAKIIQVVEFASQASGRQSVTTSLALQAPSLNGTTWSGIDSDGDLYTFMFIEGGVLTYTSPSGTHENGTWEQGDKAIYFQMNNKFSQYRGSIDGPKMTGVAQNIRGHYWQWSVSKVDGTRKKHKGT